MKNQINREIAKLEQFKVTKEDATFIKGNAYTVKESMELRIIQNLVKAGATVDDIFDIYTENNIGKFSKFATEGCSHIEKMVAQVVKPLSTIIEDHLTEKGFSFRRNLTNDEILCTLPGVDDEQPYDDYSLAVVNKEAMDTKIASKDDFKDIVRVMAAKNSYHPIKDYLESLVWDGQDHIGKLSTYVKDEHEPITYADGSQRTVIHVFLEKFLLGAIAKMYIDIAQNPMLVLFGKQGDGKSTFAQWLCPNKDWLIESDLQPENDNHIRLLREKFIWEVGELGSTIRKADKEALKSVITRQEITMRNPYDKLPTKKQAVTSFIGTINPGEDGFLNDASGHRRFNVVEISSIDWNYSKDIDINQVWAQAFTLFKQGVPYNLTKDEDTARKSINDNHEMEDPVKNALFKVCDIIDQEKLVGPTRTDDIAHAILTHTDVKMPVRQLNYAITSALVSLKFSTTKNRKKTNRGMVWYGVTLKKKYHNPDKDDNIESEIEELF